MSNQLPQHFALVTYFDFIKVKIRFNMKACVFTLLMAMNYCSLLHAENNEVSGMKNEFAVM